MDEKKSEIVAEEQEKRDWPIELVALALCFLMVIGVHASMMHEYLLWDFSLEYVVTPAVMIAILLFMIALLFVPRGWAYMAIWIACVPVGMYGAVKTLFALFIPNPCLFLPICGIATVALLCNKDVHIYFCGY